MGMTTAERRAYKQRQRDADPAGYRRRKRQEEHARRKRRVDDRPFAGCDGEGCGKDDKGRQHYMLFRMGERELYTGRPLSTHELLDFICNHPADCIAAGFSFGYDTTQILRDLDAERREFLFRPKDAGAGLSRYTYWQGFGIEYLPKNYLRVCRTQLVRWRDDATGRHALIPRPIAGSARTIYETFGFFQKSFLKSIVAFGVASKFQLQRIERNKASRGVFKKITREIRRYNQLECRLLAAMMEKFRKQCHAADIRPRTWNGAGKLSAALHAQHHTIKRDAVASWVPDGVLEAAGRAYYGGRFEVTRIGLVRGPIYEYDIGSAYPDAMRRLPCLEHGRWERTGAAALPALLDDPHALFVADVQFRHDGSGAPLCGLPIRHKSGRIYWPLEGNGTYWSHELRSAARLGASYRYKNGWRYVPSCECRPFDWIEHLFEYRKQIGKDGAGYPIKLGINGLYGKLAQRIGAATYSNPIWAGLITALTRARLNDAIAQAPGSVIMLATDALLTEQPLDLPIGDRLGDWERAEHAQIFIVQPGLYWGASRPKTRGIAPEFFAPHTEKFETAWQAYAEADQAALHDYLHGPLPPPKVALDVTLFVGLKLAQARGKPDTAGCWVERPRNFSFDWHGKRGVHRWREGPHVATFPLPGGPAVASVAYRALAGPVVNELDLERAELDDQPDHVDTGPAFLAPE